MKRYGGGSTSTVSSHKRTINPLIVEEIVADDPKLAAENQSFCVASIRLNWSSGLRLIVCLRVSRSPCLTSTSSVGRNEGLCDGDECIEGLIANQVVLEYPRQQVIGANLTGEIPILGGTSSVGYRFEAALIFPEKMRAAIELTDVQVTRNFPPKWSVRLRCA